MRPLTEGETRHVEVGRPSLPRANEYPCRDEHTTSIWTLRRRPALFSQTDRNDELRQK